MGKWDINVKIFKKISFTILIYVSKYGFLQVGPEKILRLFTFIENPFVYIDQ